MLTDLHLHPDPLRIIGILAILMVVLFQPGPLQAGIGSFLHKAIVYALKGRCNPKKKSRVFAPPASLLFILLLASACAPAQPEAMTNPPTETSTPPTATIVPATATTVPTATPAPTDTPEPTEVPALNPSARGYVSMAYDSESDKIILFGGQMEGGMIPNDETWAYDIASNTWTEMKPASRPPEKGAIDLVYDTESDRVILFGGNYGADDTWAYDYNTNTWTEMAKGPGDHLGYRMAYDSESDRCILFGGMGYPSLSLFNDTWAYDFNSDTWTEMQPSTSPSARNYHAMAYDTQADRVILFGGSEWDETMSDKALSDTWAYDFNTNTWQELEHSEGEYPAARFYHALVYNAGADRTILYGGSAGLSETWSFDYSTSTWTELEPNQNPGMLTKHALAYGSAVDQIILFGGQVGSAFDYTDQTWSFDLNSNTWTNLTRSP